MCVQNISFGQDKAFLNFLSNCEPDTIYPPLVLDENDSFYFVNGKCGKQISIRKSPFELELEGDLFDDAAQAIPQLLTMLGDVNATLCTPCDTDDTQPIAYQTAYVVRDVNQLLTIHPADAQNRIPLGENTYFFDSRNFDFGVYTLFIPSSVGGCHIKGFSQQVNKITSSQSGISLIETEGGTNLSITELQIETTDPTSQAIKFNGGGNKALDLNFLEFRPNTNWGQLIDCLQLFTTGCFSFGALQGFSLSGTCGGFALTDTRVINCGDYILGVDTSVGAATLGLQNIRTNVNATVPSGSFGFQFVEANFVNDASFSIKDARFDGAGQMVDDLVPGVPAERSVKSFFFDVQGPLRKITRPGIEWELTTQATTTISTVGDAGRTKLLGITTVDPATEVYLQQTGNNEFTHQADIEIDYIIGGQLVIDGNPNRVLKISIVKNGTTVLKSYSSAVKNSVGGADVVIFQFSKTNVMLSQGETIQFDVANMTDTSNVTLVLGSNISAYRQP